jgi:hypothetical protein
LIEPYTPAYLFAFVTRIVVFLCSCSLLPRKLVPLSVRVGLAVSFVIFFAPLIPGLELKSSNEFFNLLQSIVNAEGSNALLKTKEAEAGVLVLFPGYQVLLIEVALGLLLGISASVAAYTARLTASWLSRLVFSPLYDASSEDLPDSCMEGSLLEATVLILLLGCLFYGASSPGFWTYAGRSLFVFPYRAGFSEHGLPQAPLNVTAVVVNTGTVALTTAFLFALPVFLVSLVVDFLYLPWKRYFAQAFSDSLVASTKGPALIFLLALSLYPFTHDLSSLLEQSLDSKQVRLVLDQLKSSAAGSASQHKDPRLQE